MLAEIFMAKGEDTGEYTREGAMDAMVSGVDTSNTPDDAIIKTAGTLFWVVGTTHYITVTGAERTVLDVRACNIDDWVYR